MTKPLPDSHGGILIAEDHRQTASLLKDLLAVAFPACRIDAVSNAEEALAFCRAALPRIIVMDISMPGMDGIEATRRIKAAAPEVHVVMHSYREAEVYAEECAKAGASAFVVKAQPQTGLIPVIARLLSPTPPGEID